MRVLRASFRPGRDIAELRAYLRAREKHTDYAAAHIQHMQKALTFMNIQLDHVIASITGVTGMRIIRAIVDGESDSEKLAAMRGVRCKEVSRPFAARLSAITSQSLCSPSSRLWRCMIFINIALTNVTSKSNALWQALTWVKRCQSNRCQRPSTAADYRATRTLTCARPCTSSPARISRKSMV